MQTAKWYSCAETAKLLRKTLKAKFPNVKFSVRSHVYAGGASITAYWTDGPKTEDVKKTCDLYAGARFDGMQDMMIYRTGIMSNEDGSFEEVRYGSDFVSASRTMSPQVQAQLIEEFEKVTSEKYNEMDTYKFAVVGNYSEYRGHIAIDDKARNWGATIIDLMFQQREY